MHVWRGRSKTEKERSLEILLVGDKKLLNDRKFLEQGQWHSVDQQTIQELSSTGRHQECLQACQQLLQSEPETPLPWKYAGKSLLALGQFEESSTVPNKSASARQQLDPDQRHRQYLFKSWAIDAFTNKN